MRILRAIFGDINYNAPSWMKAIQGGVKTAIAKAISSKKTLAIAIAIAAILIGGAYSGYVWYMNEPKEIEAAALAEGETRASFSRPSKRDYRYNEHPSALSIHFANDAAPLENVGKKIAEGIKISPEIDGEWRWSSPSMIFFTPKKDWAIGERYTIKLDDAKLLAKEIKLQNSELSFDTEAFEARIRSRELYQNPENPREKNAIFLVEFNYPVDPAAFESALKMRLEQPKNSGKGAKNYKFSVKYDEKKLSAWVRSEFITLPETASQMILQVDSGVKSALGGNKSEETSVSLAVPGVYRDIVEKVFVNFVEEEDGEMGRVLSFSLADSMEAGNFARFVKAWVLPKDKEPGWGNDGWSNDKRVANYNWTVERIEITDEILAVSQPIELKAENDGLQSMVAYKIDAAEKRHIMVLVAEDKIETPGGYKGRKQKGVIVRVPEVKSQLKFAAEGSLISLKGDKKIAIAARNAKGARLDIRRVIPSQLNNILHFNSQAIYAELDFNYYTDYFSEHFTEFIRLPDTGGKIHYTGVDLGAYLAKSGAAKGIFILTLSDYDPDTKRTRDQSGRPKLVVLSDLAIIAKVSADGSQDIFVQSIKNQTPVEGARVSMLGANGIQIAVANTDSEGRARFEPFNSDRYKNEKAPNMILVEKDSDATFLPAREKWFYDRNLDYSRFDVGGVSPEYKSGALKSYLFSDRGLYRPGEEARVGIVTRAKDWSVGVGGIPVKITINDARGQLYAAFDQKIDASGLNEIMFKIAPDSPTGNWTISARIGEHADKNLRDYLLGTTYINVREFEPDRMKVSLNFTPQTKRGWYKPNEIGALVRVENLFGSPAENRRVAARSTLSPTSFKLAGFDGFSFYDGFKAKESFDFELQEVKTDEKGEAKIDLLSEEHGKATYAISLVAEAFEAGAGRSVTAAVAAIVSPNDYLVGAKADGDLSFIKKDANREVNFIAVDPSAAKIALADLTMAIYEEKFISVLTLQESGVYKYQSKLTDAQISETPFKIALNGASYKLDTAKPGNFRVEIKNQKGDGLYRLRYSVAGGGAIDAKKDKNAELDVRLTKQEYARGEEIEIAINAPYEGGGLITIEKEKIYAAKWFKAGRSSIQKIAAPRDLEGGGYVNVQFTRDYNSDEIFMSPLSYAALPFKVSLDDKRNNVAISLPKVIKPYDPLKVKVSAEKTKAIVFGIDEGILQAGSYRFQNPLDFFFQKASLAVQTMQILDLILPEFARFEKLSSPAGDDGATGKFARQLNPFKRKVEKPVAFWSGVIEINGEREIEWQTPDYFNGKLRVMAITVSAAKIGAASESVIVRDDIVLTPNMPAALAPGDEFEASVGVSNLIEDFAQGKKAAIKVKVAPNQSLEVIGDREKTISLEAMREGYLKFRLKALDKLGNAELKINAAYEEGGKSYSAKRVVTASVRPLSPFVVSSYMKRLGGGEEKYEIKRDRYAEYARSEARLSTSPLALSNGLASYLDKYEHLCSEQLIGRMIAEIFLPRAAGKAPKTSENLQILQARQNSAGSIGLWRANFEANLFVSSYAAHFLADAKEDFGVSVPVELETRLVSFLRVQAKESFNGSDVSEINDYAYAIYLLTRHKQVTANYLSPLVKRIEEYAEESFDEISPAILYAAATFKMLKNDKEAAALLAKVTARLNRAYIAAWWSRNYYDPLVVNSLAIYIISRHFPSEATAIPAQAVENIAVHLRENRYTTRSAAMTIMALNSYAKFAKSSGAKLSINAAEKGKDRKIAESVDGEAQGEFKVTDDTIIFKSDNSKTSAWSVAVMEGFDRAQPKEAIKKGLEIYREYHDANGNKISKIKVGESVFVTIRAKALTGGGVDNVAITDILPGAFEVVVQPQEQNSDEDEETDERHNGYKPIFQKSGDIYLDYGDMREDRVILYAYVGGDALSFTYEIKATNAGKFATAPIYAEAMYDREIRALGLPSGYIEVESAE
ncbi:MAG: alpha-2-macroglobulin family protein [Helicobacteraceae bacterium]|jgi:uncharacterized protein YfaS (alpha-2-macroglobulin family)|nr:alpha-2-macroglobulin family protein [Helicobacteraceae bacterium]